MNTEYFNSVPTFSSSAGIIEEQNFYPAPRDWLIVIADIRNSTKAVEAGKYKDVNMIGGAVICAIQNATGSRDWPFVFGGDGATVLIEPGVRSSVEEALVRTRTLAMDKFDLDLKIGIVPVVDVCDKGIDVLVARYEITPDNFLAQFGGGGVEAADALVKSDLSSEKYLVRDYSLPGAPDLTGLSCRWEPLQTQKGKILCILIKPYGNSSQQKHLVLSNFLSELSKVIGPDLDQASPVTENSMRFTWPPKGLAAEAKTTQADKRYIHRIIELYCESFIQWVLNRFNLNAADYNAPVYREELKDSSDFCRFDDILRLVLDCTDEQTDGVRLLLDTMHSADDIDFGFFKTEQALMTCLLFDLKSSQHVHFIDGSDGGFYSASVGLKEQLSSRV